MHVILINGSGFMVSFSTRKFSALGCIFLVNLSTVTYLGVGELRIYYSSSTPLEVSRCDANPVLFFS